MDAEAGEQLNIEHKNGASDSVSQYIAEDAPEEYPSGSRLVFIVIALVLSVFLSNLDLTIVATAIPKITDDFNGLHKVSWYSSAFFLTSGSTESAWGKIYKYFDLKTAFLVSVFIFELGSLICGVAPNSDVLILGRSIAGIGSAGLSTGAFIIIAFIAPPPKRPIYTGFVGIAFGVAAVLGPLLGGVFTTTVSWRWCFYINLPVGGISAAIIFFFFHTPSGAKSTAASWPEKLRQLDPVGVVLMLCALLSFGLALQKGGQTEPWNSATVIGLLAGFVAILIAFTIWEFFADDRAMINLRILTTRSVGVSCAFAGFFTGSYFLVIYYLPIYFQSVDGDSAALSGVHNLPLILTSTAAVIGAAGFVTATRQAVPVAIGGAAISMVGSGLLYTLNLHTRTGLWIGYQIIGGIGWGSALQIPIMIAQASADPAELPVVTAVVLFFFNIGASLLLLSAQSAFVNTLAISLRKNAPNIDPAVVVATGATALRTTFRSDELQYILIGYVKGIKNVFAIAVAAGGIAFCVAWLFKWEKLNTEVVDDTAVRPGSNSKSEMRSDHEERT